MLNKPRRTENSLSASSPTHLVGSQDGFYKEGFSSEGRPWEETEGGVRQSQRDTDSDLTLQAQF